MMAIIVNRIPFKPGDEGNYFHPRSSVPEHFLPDADLLPFPLSQRCPVPKNHIFVACKVDARLRQYCEVRFRSRSWIQHDNRNNRMEKKGQKRAVNSTWHPLNVGKSGFASKAQNIDDITPHSILELISQIANSFLIWTIWLDTCELELLAIRCGSGEAFCYFMTQAI